MVVDVGYVEAQIKKRVDESGKKIVKRELISFVDSFSLILWNTETDRLAGFEVITVENTDEKLDWIFEKLLEE